MSKFKPLRFNFEKIHIQGGHTVKSLPMVSRTVEGPDKQNITFVKMAVSEAWLIMATTGQSKHTASSFGRTSLLEDLRVHIQNLCDGVESASSVVPQDGNDYDPMAEVEQTDESAQPSSKTVGRGQKRARYYRNHSSKQVVTLSMPVRCPEEDPQCEEVRKIRLYIEDRIQVWLDLADVEWAVRYLYVQNLLKGVPLIAEDSTGPVTAA